MKKIEIPSKQIRLNVESLERISLSGGEPLLFPYISKITEICSSYADRVTIVTNGSLPNVIDKICRYVDEIHFSVDTIDYEKYKRIKGLEITNVMESIMIAKDENKKIRINVVVNDELLSLNDIEALHGFCLEHGLTLSLIKPF